jgi:hypothetical protein
LTRPDLNALGAVIVGAGEQAATLPAPAPMVVLDKPGLYANVPFGHYLQDCCERPSLSSSCAKALLDRSPLHAWYEHPRLGGGDLVEAPTVEMDRGTVIHALALGGGQDYVAVPFADWRTNDAKKQRDDARAAGLIPILAFQLDACQEAAERIKPLLPADCEREVVAVWESESRVGAPVLCRGRHDMVARHSAHAADLKTCRDAARMAAARSLVSEYRDMEAACRLDSLEVLLPDLAGRWSFSYLLIEPQPPYAAVRVDIAGPMLELGRRKWRRAVETWGGCLAGGMEQHHWPGPFGGYSRPEPPPWALEADLDQQLAGLPANSGGEFFGL